MELHFIPEVKVLKLLSSVEMTLEELVSTVDGELIYQHYMFQL